MRQFRRFCCSLAVFAVILIARPASAQDDPNFEIGLKPFGSYHIGDIDYVDLANGTLNVDIPLISYPQRGGKLKLDFALRYQNKSWYADGGCYEVYGYEVCYAIYGGSSSGFAIVDEGAVVQSYPGAEAVCSYVPVDEVDETQCNTSLQDGTGATHLLVPTTTSSLESIDATAYHAAGFESTLTSITDPEGTSYNTQSEDCLFEWSSSMSAYPTGPASCDLSREDANGNEITFSSTTGWADTMGRVIPLPTQSTSQSEFTGCTGTQTVSFVVLWNLPGVNGGAYPLKLCFFTDSSEAYVAPVPKVESVILPNGTTWTFTYTTDHIDNLSQITFPTGGSLAYTWTSTDLCQTHQYINNYAVATRELNPNDGVDPAGTWSYSYGVGSNGWNSGVTTVTDPAGNSTLHTAGLPNNNGYAATCSPYETQVLYYQGSQTNGTLLRTVNKSYNYTAYTANWTPTVLNVVPSVTATIWANGQQNQVTYTEDSGFTYYQPLYYGNAIEGTQYTNGTYGRQLTKAEYDYGNGAHGSLLRTTTTTYLAFSSSSYLSANMLDLPSSVQVTGAGPGSLTDYYYDQNNGSPQGILGNLTSTSRWLNTTSSYLVTSNVYNSNGLVTSSTDPNGNQTTFGYTGSYAGSGPTSVTNAKQQTTTNAYDSDTGLLTSRTDPNGQTTSYYYDPMLRTVQIDNPDGGQSLFCYTDTGTETNGGTCSESSPPYEVVISEKINSSSNRLSYLMVDGVGRQIRQAVTNGEAEPYDEIDTCYNGNGLVSFKSYPFQDSGPFATSRECASPELGDTFVYDALKRTTSVTHSDGTSVLTSYTGRATSVQDEGNGTQRVQRISQVDGLGRLTSICEVTSTTLVGISGSTTPAACGQDIAATGFLTTYAYDALDDLTSVAQGPLNARTFVYDSLSRLTSATNPESGTTVYTYDADGNVLTKTDARNITTTFAYNALNQITGKTYSDGTPTATYNYGESSSHGVTLTNTVGRKSSESTAGSNATGSVFSYDSMGRVLNNSQCTPQNWSGTPFSLVYTYDLLGDATTSANGAGVTLTNSYNVGARLTSVTSSLSGSNFPSTLFSNAHYNAAGSLISGTLGNGVNETRTYDGRLRLNGITDGSLYTVTIPTSGGYAPNSDILAANDSVNGNWTYSYDPFNRLTGSNQNSGTLAYAYSYDRFGNRWSQAVTAGSGPNSSLGFDANNHIVSGSGVSYDAAGDTTNDGTTAYTFDAEGRISTAVNNSSGTSTYVYDAEGRRIRKTTVAGGTVDFLYDLAGHEISQISSTGTWTRGEVYAGGRHLATYSGGTGGTTYFTHADWLGTERARSTVTGSAYETCTSLPFGDWLTCSGGDPSPMHFTGKERDSESNLDNFSARYDSSAMGRFMSPDWSVDPDPVPYAKLGDPQSLNLYAYVRNNPVTLTDADGHCWGWIQWLCNTGQRVFYWTFTDWGWMTKAQIIQYKRDYLIKQQPEINGERRDYTKATNQQVEDDWKKVQDAFKNNTVSPYSPGGVPESTGRTEPANLQEQLAMQQAKSNPSAGTKIPIDMKDPRWPADQGWVKMQQNINGVEVHYNLNTVTGETADWKFK